MLLPAQIPEEGVTIADPAMGVLVQLPPGTISIPNGVSPVPQVPVAAAYPPYKRWLVPEVVTFATPLSPAIVLSVFTSMISASEGSYANGNCNVTPYNEPGSIPANVNPLTCWKHCVN